MGFLSVHFQGHDRTGPWQWKTILTLDVAEVCVPVPVVRGAELIADKISVEPESFAALIVFTDISRKPEEPPECGSCIVIRIEKAKGNA